MAVAMIGPKFYGWDKNGKPLAFGKLYTYQARTNDPKDTYQSEDQIVPNTNPVILNGEGYANVYLSGSYKMVLKDKDENEVWSSDPVSSAEPSEWVVCLTATYLSSTSFKVNGNFVAQYEPGRRIRIDNNTSEYAYSTIETSVFAAGETTVTIIDPFITTGVQEVCVSIIGPESRATDQVLNYDTLQDLLDSKVIKEGDSIDLKERVQGNGGGAKWDAVLVSGVTPDGGGILQSIGVPELAVVLRHEGHITGEQYGLVGDDATDNASLFNTMAADQTIKHLTIDNDYLIQSDVTFNRSIKITGDGKVRGESARFIIQGSLTDLGVVSSSAANEGSRTINIAGLSGLSEGDLIIIHNQSDYSFSPHRANYQDGEFAEVKSVSGDLVTLTKPLESTYAAVSTNRVFKVNSVTPVVKGISFDGDTGYQFEISFARGGHLKPKRINGGTSGAFVLNKSYGTEIFGGEYFNKSADTGLQYGIAILNSQDINGYGVRAHGTRHGVTTGGDGSDGAVPCRRVKFHNSVISNDDPAIHCTDFHGNAKDCGYYECDSMGDVLLGGIDVEFIGGSIVAAQSASPIGGGETNGGYIRYKRVKIKFTDQSTATTMFKFRDSDETAKIENDFHVDISDIEIENNLLLTILLTLFVNAPATTKSKWSMRRIKPENQLVGIQRVVSGTLTGTGIAPESIVVEDIDLDPASIQFWMSTSGIFTGTRITLPPTHYRDSFTVSAGGKLSSNKTFDFPFYPTVPLLSLSTDGGVIDATGGHLVPHQRAALAADSATLAVETSTNANATANMDTDIIASVSMNNFVR